MLIDLTRSLVNHKILIFWFGLLTTVPGRPETQYPDSLQTAAADTADTSGVPVRVTGSCATVPDSSVFLNPDSTLTDSLQFTAGSDSAGTVPDSAFPDVPFVFRSLENSAFRPGEYLEFEIAWKFFKAGTATMSVADTLYRDRPCYHIKTTARSSSTIDAFYKVRDRVESFVDKEGLFPWKFEKHLREGKFRRDRFTEFDQTRQIATLKKDTIDVPPYVQDILSRFYYVRILPLEVGKHFDIENLTDRKVYPLRILVHKKETVKVPAGRFKCIVVEPVLRGEGLFNQKGRLMIWLTDDVRKMPVMMKSEVFIGTVDVKLRKYRNTVGE